MYDLYYTFECTGLNEAARDLANFIATNELGEDIWLIGHSKCGVCFYKAIEYISTYLIRSKIYLVTISAPFNGTIMASNRFKKIPKRMNFLLNFVHGLLFSDHAVDKDISPHSEFLSSLPCESYVLRVCTHYNICSTLVETHFWDPEVGTCDATLLQDRDILSLRFHALEVTVCLKRAIGHGFTVSRTRRASVERAHSHSDGCFIIPRSRLDRKKLPFDKSHKIY